MGAMRPLLFALGILLVLGCTLQPAAEPERHRGHVVCVPIVDGFECSLSHTRGSNPIEICWKLDLTCRNDLSTSFRRCGEVSPGRRATMVVPFEEIPAWDECDEVYRVSVLDEAIAVR